MRARRLAVLRQRRWARYEPLSEAESDRLDQRYLESYLQAPCGWGHCETVYDEIGRPGIGVGRVMCPCEWSTQPTGRRRGMGTRPAAPVKPTGRHGSRVQRSRSRAAAMRARADYEDLLDPIVPDFFLSRPRG